MADNCIFCGKDITFWNSDVLICGGVSQPVCFDCRDRYAMLPLRQRARLALETGRAKSPEEIQKYLDQMDEKLDMEARRQERQREVMRCCGGEMTRLDEVSFMNRVGWIQTYTDEMVMFRCERCGQIKFFDSSYLRYTTEEKEVLVPPESQETKRVKPGKKPPWEK